MNKEIAILAAGALAGIGAGVFIMRQQMKQAHKEGVLVEKLENCPKCKAMPWVFAGAGVAAYFMAQQFKG